MVDRQVSITARLIDRFSQPASVVQRRFAGIEARLTAITSRLGPLASGFAAVGAGLAGIAGARRAIDLAEVQVDSELRVLAALQGREKSLQRILDITSQIQRETRIGDETLNDSAATLINMGVAVDQVDQALRAAVDTAASLGVETSLVERALGRIAGGSTSAGLLGTRLPFLNELIQQGGDLQDVLDELEDRFGGVAAELASSEFGRGVQLQNELGDAYEEIGKKLVTVRNIFRESLLRLIQSFNSALDSPAFASFVRLAEQLAPFLTKAAIAAGGLLAALLAIKAGAFLLGLLGSAAALVGVLGSILALVISIAPELAITGGALAGILDFLSGGRIRAGEFADELGRAKDDVIDLFQEFARGDISFDALLDGLINALTNVGLRANSELIVPLQAGFDATATQTEAAFTASFLRVKRFLLETFGDVLQFVEDTANKLIFKAVSAIVRLENPDLPEVAVGGIAGTIFSQINLDLAPDFSDDFDDIDRRIEQSAQDYVDAWVKADAEVEASRVATDAVIAAKNAALAARLVQDREEITEQERRSAAEEIEIFRRRQLAIQASSEQLAESIRNASTLNASIASPEELLNLTPEELAQFVGNATGQAASSIGDVLIESLRRQLDAEAISTAQYFERRQAIEQTLNRERLSGLDDQLAALREQEQALIDQVPAVTETVDAIRDSLEIEGEIADTRREILRLEQQRSGILISVAQSQAALEDELNSTIADSVSQAGTLGDELERQIELLERARDLGTITDGDALAQADQAFQDFGGEIQSIIADLVQLKEEFPEIAPAVNEAIEQIGATGEQIDNLKANNNDFFQGIIDGFRQSTEVTQTWGQVGEQTSGILINALGDGIDIALGESEQSFKEWVRNFILEIAKLILKVKLLKLLFGETADEAGQIGTSGEAGQGGLLGGLLGSLGGGTSGAVTTNQAPAGLSGLVAGAGGAPPLGGAGGAGGGLLGLLGLLGGGGAAGGAGGLLGLLGGAGGAGAAGGLASLLPLLFGAGTGGLGFLLAPLLGGLFGGGGGGGLLSLFGGGAFGLFNSGGRIPGGGPDKDTVLIGATPGENVINRRATNYYTQAVMDAINDMSIPRSLLLPHSARAARSAAQRQFNSGGPVGRTGRTSDRGGPSKSVVVPSDGDFYRMASGGRSGFFRFLREEKATVNALLKDSNS